VIRRSIPEFAGFIYENDHSILLSCGYCAAFRRADVAFIDTYLRKFRGLAAARVRIGPDQQPVGLRPFRLLVQTADAVWSWIRNIKRKFLVGRDFLRGKASKQYARPFWLGLDRQTLMFLPYDLREWSGP
jgi:hypothetical protein